MVGVTALWLPIVLSAVIVFFASFVIHMVLKYHWGDWTKLPSEEALMEAMRKAGVGPGNYAFPRAADMKEMQSEAFIEKCRKGPVGLVAVLPSGPPAMGKNLVQWFIFSLVAGVFAAYVAGRTLAPGTDYLQVFRITGTTAFLAYAGCEPVASIWKGAKWSTTIKHVFDGLIYALLTAGCFGWLWPEA